MVVDKTLKESKLYALCRKMKTECVTHAHAETSQAEVQDITKLLDQFKRDNAAPDTDATRIFLIYQSADTARVISYLDPVRLSETINIDRFYDHICDQDPDRDPLQDLEYPIRIALFEALSAQTHKVIHELPSSPDNDTETIMLEHVFSLISVIFDDPKEAYVLIGLSRQDGQIRSELKAFWSKDR